jgi:hypothetical protein
MGARYVLGNFQTGAKQWNLSPALAPLAPLALNGSNEQPLPLAKDAKNAKSGMPLRRLSLDCAGLKRPFPCRGSSGFSTSDVSDERRWKSPENRPSSSAPLRDNRAVRIGVCVPFAPFAPLAFRIPTVCSPAFRRKNQDQKKGILLWMAARLAGDGSPCPMRQRLPR